MADFQFGLNTSTIRPTPLIEQIKIAGRAGYDAIELWIDDVEAYVDRGGAVDDVRKALDDEELARPSAISLKGWCVADDREFDAAQAVARRRLELARQLGIDRIVAGPAHEPVPLELAARRYGELLRTSVELGVPASLEFLGFTRGITTLEQAWVVCSAVDDPQATMTVDAWHLFRGGSRDETLASIPAERISCVHWNDAPADPPREQQDDSHRVMPGDGILDLAELAARLRRIGWHGTLSLELFNSDYWNQDPFVVAREGLEKMRASLG